VTVPSEGISLIGVNLETQFKDEDLGKASGDWLKNIVSDFKQCGLSPKVKSII